MYVRRSKVVISAPAGRYVGPLCWFSAGWTLRCLPS